MAGQFLGMYAKECALCVINERVFVHVEADFQGVCGRHLWPWQRFSNAHLRRMPTALNPVILSSSYHA